MRFVNRNEVPTPEVLVSETAKGPTETAEAIKIYTEWMALPDPKDPVDFLFKAFKDNSVKIALEKLFLGKCAYCEGYYLSLHPVDIEHWRPKKAVDIEGGEQRKFGYFWLAASWENLLPSCIDCNRARKHKDYFAKDKVITIGKKNQFPLADETKRATLPDSLHFESPLLIDPCKDDPNQHLVFHPEGYVSPRLGDDGKPSPKGIASIRVYALNRTELVQDRRARALLIERRMQSIQSLGKLSQSVSDEDSLFLVEELLAREVKELRDFQEPGAIFSALARTMIEPFINAIKIDD